MLLEVNYKSDVTVNRAAYDLSLDLCRTMLARGIVPVCMYDMLDALLALHPRASDKVGVGVAGYFVSSAPDYPKARCLWLRRTDGTVEDWSYRKCLARIPQVATDEQFQEACARVRKALGR